MSAPDPCGRGIRGAPISALVLALTAAGLAPAAWAAPDARAGGPTRAAVEARLQQARHGLSSSELAELGANAGPLLIEIAGDKAAATPVRLRAMSALAYARTPAAHDFLESFLIRNRPSSDPVDRALLRKGAIAFGWQGGPRSVDVLAPLLDHADVEVRLDAVVALGLTRARGAEKPLRDRLANEPDAGVRAQIESQLKVLVAPGEKSGEGR